MIKISLWLFLKHSEEGSPSLCSSLRFFRSQQNVSQARGERISAVPRVVNWLISSLFFVFLGVCVYVWSLAEVSRYRTELKRSGQSQRAAVRGREGFGWGQWIIPKNETVTHTPAKGNNGAAVSVVVSSKRKAPYDPWLLSFVCRTPFPPLNTS